MFDSWNTTVDGLRRNRRIVPREMPIGTAVVGCGYWGPNLARNLAERSEFQLQALCDRDPARLGPLAGRYPDALALGDLEEVLCDDSIEAVVVATPPKTHHAIVKQVLEAGKHVLVEKPLATRLVRRPRACRYCRGLRARADAWSHFHLQPRGQRGA